MIYLDNNATTAPHPAVVDAMLPYLRESWHNPSSGYRAAKEVRAAIETARAQVAALINASPEEIVFTSGGTESTNMALKWLARLVGRKSGRVVTTAIEHSAVLRPCETFAEVGYPVDLVAVSPDGRLLLDEFAAACARARDGGGFASVMWANNETGVIQPIHDACAIAKEAGLAFHTDAVQAVGKIPLDVRALAADFLSLSAHKFHGPKGIGALYVRSGVRVEPLMRGGGQEAGRRGGTENVPAIVAMGAAAAIAAKANNEAVRALRDAFEVALVTGITGVHPNGNPAHRLPNTCHLSFEGCDAAGLLILLDEYGVQCSAGSACMTGQQEPSHVQRAMGIPESLAKTSLRFSLSSNTTAEEITQAAAAVARAVAKLRSVQGGGVGPVVVYS
jgi:cysteine desulfurase